MPFGPVSVRGTPKPPQRRGQPEPPRAPTRPRPPLAARSIRMGGGQHNEAADGSASKSVAPGRGARTRERSRGATPCDRRRLGQTEPYERAIVDAKMPAPQPYEIAGQPRINASSTVNPPVEWTRTSAAASHSGISSVNPSTRTRSSSANRACSCIQPLVPAAQAHDRRDIGEQQCLLDRSLDIAHSPTATRDEHNPPLDRQRQLHSSVLAAKGRSERRQCKAVNARNGRGCADDARAPPRWTRGVSRDGRRIPRLAQ